MGVDMLTSAFTRRGGIVIMGTGAPLETRIQAHLANSPVLALSENTKNHFFLNAFRNEDDSKMLVTLLPYEPNAGIAFRPDMKASTAPDTAMSGIALLLPKGKTPAKALDVMTGKALKITARPNGTHRILLPPMQTIGAVSIQWNMPGNTPP